MLINPNERTEKRNTKQVIFETAIDLFSKEGYSGVSIRDITGAVGIKESSLYKHYKNKDALLEEIFDYFAKEVKFSRPTDEEADALLDLFDPESFFRHVIVVFGQRITPMMDQIFRILMMEQFRSERAREFVLSELVRGNEHFAAKTLAKMRERGQIVHCEIDQVATAYGYTLFALSLEYNIVKYSGGDVRMVIQKMMSHVKHIIAPLQTK